MIQSKKRICLIEDDKDIRASFSLIINGSEKFEVVGSYGSYEEAIKYYFKSIPDIVLMDIHLPGTSGIEATRIIKEQHPQAEIIMVTVYEDDEMVFEALKAGATGYITKSSNFMELIDALEEVLKGGAPMSSRIARMVIRNYHINLNSPLTKREKQILNMIAAGETYTTIAEELNISKQTSKTHIRNIYAKLHVNRKADAISIAHRERYI